MPTTTLELVRANFSRRTEIQNELREIDEKCTTEKRDYDEAEANSVAEKRNELKAIDDRITANLDAEVRADAITSGLDRLLGVFADHQSGDAVDMRTMGRRFTESEEIRSWVKAGARGSSPSVEADMSFRAVTDTTTGATSGGAFIVKQRLDRVGMTFLDRKVYLLDLLPTIQMTTSAVEYVQDNSPLADVANKAAEVTEGSAKPQAGITMAVVTEAAATIAAWANLTRQVAADAPQVAGYVDGRLRYSLKRRADGQAINGNGTPPNLLGLANRAGILTYAPGAAEARYKSIRHGVRMMEDAEAVPEIICLNPADAEIFDLSNEATAGLHAIDFNGLATAGARTSWGLQQVRSTAIAAGTALLIDPMVVAVLDRMAATAYMTDSHASNFIANILTLLLETRLGLALFDPTGILKITFNGTT